MISIKTLATGILICSTTFLFAQQPKEAVDAKAKAILDEVAKQTKTYTSIKTEFTSVMEKQESNVKSAVTETQSGSLELKGAKYKLSFKGQTIFCDSKTQWTYIKESNEVQINNAPDPNATDNINPVNIFTLYEKGYKYKYEKEDIVNGAKVDIISLFPLDPDKKSYHTIRLTIDKVKKQITVVKILNKNGTSNTISVKNFTPNSEMTDMMFTFNKADYKGVEVVDLRDN
ncbi:MAG: outer membrane lipoprotein carrier protein LolA [Bacteroidetes bacterium]|nr:outer membrane lipoprotein carrier protein LolA [Bacteroidota bacterium]